MTRIRLFTASLLLITIIWNNVVTALPPLTDSSNSDPNDTYKFVDKNLKKFGRTYRYAGRYGELPAFYKCTKIEELYKREISILDRINNAPHTAVSGRRYVVQKYANYEYNSKYCIVYEYAGQLIIGDVATNKDLVTMDRLFNQAVLGFAFLHSIGIVHGDIKQDNILISGNSPENYVVKIIDFDLAQFIETAVPIQHIQNDMNPPDYYKKLKDYNPRLLDSWQLGVLFFKFLIGANKNHTLFKKNTKSYAYISNYLNKSPLAKFGSAVNLLVPNRKKSLKEKVLMLVNTLDKRSTPEEMVQCLAIERALV